MSTQIGSLIVRVGSDISGLTEGLAQGEAATRSFAGNVRGSIDVMGKLAIAAAAAGAAVVAAMVTNAMDAIDAQAKLARALDSSSKGLATLQHAAELAGVSNETLEGALRKLNNTIGEAAGGNKEARDTFDRLRLSADELSNLDADERVALINERIRQFIPVAEQASVSSQLFGRSVGNALREIDSSSIQLSRKEVEALGLAVSKVDAETIARANDAMTTLRKVVDGVANRISVALAPVIEWVAVSLKDTAVEARGFESHIDSAMSVAVRATAYFLDVLRGLHLTYKLLETTGREWQVAFLKIMTDATEAVARLVDSSTRGANEIIRAMNRIPGVNIAEIMFSGEREWASRLGTMYAEAAWAARDARKEFELLASKPLPSEGVEEFLERLKAAARAASEAALLARDALGGGGGRGGPAAGARLGNEAEAAALAEEEQLQAEIARLKDHVLQRVVVLQEGLLSEEEQRQLAFERQVEQLQEALAWEQLTVEQFHALRQQLEEKHMKDLAKIRERGWTDIQRFENATLSQQVKTVADHLSSITAGVARENKTMFEINKVAGIAQAIVNAYVGISKTLSSYPYPINVGLAAAHAAAAFAQVNAIRSQQFGGGAAAAPALAGGTPATPVTPVPATDAGGAGALDRTITVSGISEGEIFSGGRMRALIDNLLEEQRNGARVVLV